MQAVQTIQISAEAGTGQPAKANSSGEGFKCTLAETMQGGRSTAGRPEEDKPSAQAAAKGKSEEIGPAKGEKQGQQTETGTAQNASDAAGETKTDDSADKEENIRNVIIIPNLILACQASLSISFPQEAGAEGGQMQKGDPAAQAADVAEVLQADAPSVTRGIQLMAVLQNTAPEASVQPALSVSDAAAVHTGETQDTTDQTAPALSIQAKAAVPASQNGAAQATAIPGTEIPSSHGFNNQAGAASGNGPGISAAVKAAAVDGQSSSPTVSSQDPDIIGGQAVSQAWAVSASGEADTQRGGQAAEVTAAGAAKAGTTVSGQNGNSTQASLPLKPTEAPDISPAGPGVSSSVTESKPDVRNTQSVPGPAQNSGLSTDTARQIQAAPVQTEQAEAPVSETQAAPAVKAKQAGQTADPKGVSGQAQAADTVSGSSEASTASRARSTAKQESGEASAQSDSSGQQFGQTFAQTAGADTSGQVKNTDPDNSGSLQNIADIAKQISDAYKAAADSGKSEIRIHLSPKELGGINIRMVSQNGSITLMITADHQKTGQLLASGLADLTRSISDSGITMSSVHVLSASAGCFDNAGSFSGFSSESRQQSYGGGYHYSGAAQDEAQEDEQAIYGGTMSILA